MKTGLKSRSVDLFELRSLKGFHYKSRSRISTSQDFLRLQFPRVKIIITTGLDSGFKNKTPCQRKRRYWVVADTGFWQVVCEARASLSSLVPTYFTILSFDEACSYYSHTGRFSVLVSNQNSTKGAVIQTLSGKYITEQRFWSAGNSAFLSSETKNLIYIETW